MRKPLERENGQYTKALYKLEEYAEEVATELCELYPDVDIIDIQFIFQKKLSYSMAMKLVEYSALAREENSVR